MKEIKTKRITDMNAFAAEVHENAVQHGWWNPTPPFEAVALMCITEIAEATDEYRNDMPMCYVMKKTCAECPDYPVGARYMETDMSKWTPDDKPEGVAVEMADCIIRILDWFGAHPELDLEAILTAKHEYNRGRSYRHGNKRL